MGGGGMLTLGGAAANPPFSATTTTAGAHKTPSSASSSSSSSSRYISYNSKPACTCSYCSCSTQTCTSRGKRPPSLLSNPNYLMATAPSQFEVQNAIIALQNFLQGTCSFGSGLDNFGPTSHSYDSRIRHSNGNGSVYDTFRLLQTDPIVQRMVASLSSDEAFWKAVVNNEVVQKMQGSLHTAEEATPRSSNTDQDLAATILRWVLEITKAKVLELMEQFRLLLNHVFQYPEAGKPVTRAETAGSLEEKLSSSLLLSVVILLIVVLTRAHVIS